MSLLGVDIGTTGCKTIAFSLAGETLASDYREYGNRSGAPGTSELDSAEVWKHIRDTITSVSARCADDPIQAVSFSSLGESVVPVTKNREILGPSLLMDDIRGAEFVPILASRISDEELYSVNGNTLGNHYGITKMMWYRQYQPELYRRTDHFLSWAAFAAFMLGADASVDFSLANRSLLFDLDAEDWSSRLIGLSGIDENKLPVPVPSGTIIGKVSGLAGKEIGLSPGTAIVSGAHDQCANSLGCGASVPGTAMFGMGTYLCIVPAYTGRKDGGQMRALGLNTEHHSIPGRYASFIYNQGGSLVKWFRDALVLGGESVTQEKLSGLYGRLDNEMPDRPSSVLVLPHFSVTGPPYFLSDSTGLVAGLTLSTTRGDILKGVLEGAIYYLLETVDQLPLVDIDIDRMRIVGGGSKSDAWVQLAADIMNRPMERPDVTEAGAMGAAIMAGTATGRFSSMEDGAESMIRIEKEYTPDQTMNLRYRERFELYKEMYPLLGSFLQRI